jgi:peptidoglycan hydrolase-like protein with peptidoglycan-binding domain
MEGARATMAMSGAMTRQADPNATVVVRQPTIAPPVAPPTVAPAPASKRTRRRWLAAAVLLIFAAAGGYRYAMRPPAVDVAAQASAVQQQRELEGLRADKLKRDQEAHDAEIKRQAAAETRQKVLAEEAEQKRLADAAAAKAAADAAERQKALEADRAKAADAETRLGFTLLDRQHVQVALTSLGFATNRTDGVFAAHTRDMIAEWQKTHAHPDTGYLTGPQDQELLKAGAAAIAKFDDDQKKTAAAATHSQTPPAAAPAAPAVPQNVPSTASGDGLWTGTYKCQTNNIGAPFMMPVRIVVQGGHGIHTVAGSTETTPGNHSLAMTISGGNVTFARTYLATGGKNAGTLNTAVLNARFEGGTITGTGQESQGNRICTVILTR